MTNLHMTDHNILEKKQGKGPKQGTKSTKHQQQILSFQFKLGSRHLTFAK